MNTNSHSALLVQGSELGFQDLYRGNIDSADKHSICGWVCSLGNPLASLTVNFLISGQLIKSVPASLYREDLHRNNVGHGNCAFVIELPEIFRPSSQGNVEACSLEVIGDQGAHIMGIGEYGADGLQLNLVSELVAELVNDAQLESTMTAKENDTGEQYGSVEFPVDPDVNNETDQRQVLVVDGAPGNDSLVADRDFAASDADISVHANNADSDASEHDSAPVEPTHSNIELPAESDDLPLLDDDCEIAESAAIVEAENNQTHFLENFKGNVEAIGGNLISGWVLDKHNHSNSVAVMLMVNGVCSARIVANQYRPDIQDAGFGNGHCGFKVDLVKHGMTEKELCGATLVVEVVSQEREAVMFAGHIPSELGSLPEECKRALLSAFEPFQQAAPVIENSEAREHGFSAECFSNGVTQAMYRKNGEQPTASVNGDIPVLSPYVVFTRDRLNQHKTFEFENDPRIAVDLLLWYIEGYGGTRKPHKIPLSNEEINYCNEMVVFPNTVYSFSRLHYYMLLRNKPEMNILGVLNNEEAYRAEVFEWVESTCVKLNILDICVPGEYVDLLGSVQWDSKGFEYPLNKYFETKLLNTSRWSCFDLSKSLHRGCVYLMLIIDGLEDLNNIRFIPDEVKRQFFEKNDFLNELNRDVLEPFYGVALDCDSFRQTIKSKLAKSGVDIVSGQFLTRSLNGDRHAFANPYNQDLGPDVYDIQLIGPLDKASGLGQATRLSANVLELFPRSHNFVNFDLDNPAPEGYSTAINSGKLSKAKVNLIHLNAESIPFVMAYCPDVFTDSYNIGYFFWELDTPARCHNLALELLDEVWVCTEYGVSQYKDHCDIPVVNVGMTYESHTTPDKHYCKDYLKKEFGVPTDTTVFLATFDSFSFVQRKNPLAAINAFKECFQGDENVQLLIKTQNKSFVGDPAQLKIWRAIEFAIGGDQRIKLINRTFNYEELLTFKKAADCYVSLHRSEGWGFGMIEAMTLSVPVIATHYSGNLEFCKNDNCWLVDASEKFLSESDYIFVVPGQKWAEPDISHAARAMRECYDNPQLREQKAGKAEDFVLQHFSTDAISSRYEKRLHEIYASL